MITIEKARALLGDTAKDMSDEEVEEITSHLRMLAEICIDSYLSKKRKLYKKDNKLL